MNLRSEAHTGIGRVAVAATLAGLLGVSTIAMPTTAFAETTTTRSYTWKDGEQQPTAAQTVTSNGVTYTLKETSKPVKSGKNSTLTQSFTTTQTGTASDINGVQSAVPSSTQYSEDGYNGTLYRTSVSYTPVYANKDRTDTATRTGTSKIVSKEHPSDNEVPETIYQNGHQLTRTSVTWKEGQGDAQGSTWQYTAQYSGTYQERVLDHYNVTGSYSGNLTKTVSGGTWSMTATYTAPDQQQNADDAGDTQTLGEDQNANQEDTQNQDADNTNDGNADDTDNSASGYEMQNAENANDKGSKDNGKNANANGTKETDGILGTVRKHPMLLLVPVILIIAIIAAIVAAAKRKHKAAAGAGVAPLAIPADIYGLNAELIEFVNDGTDENQHIIATCDAYMSPDADTPNLVEIPQPPMHFEPAATTDADGNPVFDEEGNQVYDDYYIVLNDTSYDAVASGMTDDSGYATLEDVPNGNYLAVTSDGQPQPVIVSNDTAIDTELVANGSEPDLDVASITRDNVGLVPGDATVRVFVSDADGNPIAGKTVDLLSDGLLSSAKSPRLVIESNGRAIYDGALATQVKLDSTLLADVLNDEHATGTTNDITEDVDRWLNAYEDYDEHRNETIEQARWQREESVQQEAAEQDTSTIPTDATGSTNATDATGSADTTDATGSDMDDFDDIDASPTDATDDDDDFGLDDIDYDNPANFG